MSIENARRYLQEFEMDKFIVELDASSATVELAAKAIGCEEARIAKTLSFKAHDEYILVVAAGTAKIDNGKYKKTFGAKAKMLSADEVEPAIGHAVGGVCPFGVKGNVKIYLDVSLRQFETVYPACGSSNSCIELNMEQLEKLSKCVSWVDVCKMPEQK